MTTVNRCRPACPPASCDTSDECCQTIFYNSQGDTISGGVFLVPQGATAGERPGEILITRSGTLSNLQVQVDSGPTAGNPDVVVVRRNETDTALAVTISYPATSGTDTSDSVVVAPGDRIALNVKSASGTDPIMLASFDFCPSCAPC